MEEKEIKNVYIVRHGESVANAARIHQGPDEELSESGREQAEILADRISKIEIDCIISSTMKRAKDTAIVVARKISRQVEYFNEFAEVRGPSEIIGVPEDSEEWMGVMREIRLHFGSGDWKYSDEENFTDLKSRALRALEIVAAREERNILVLSHGQFIRLMIMTMMFGDDLSPKELLAAYKFFVSTNTGITWCVYSAGRWVLKTWMDHAHLGV